MTPGFANLKTISLTHDTWHEVLQYFQYDITCDDNAEIREKRKDILSIALTSQSLVAIALGVLWAGMTSLEPVTNVVNSFTSSLEGLYFEKVEVGNGQDTEWCWELRRPIEDDAVRSRAQEYLARVRTYLINENEVEPSLWLVLAACFRSDAPLLPKLQHLHLIREELPTPPTINLIPLLFPVSTSLEITHRSSNVDAALMLLRLLRSRGCRLKRIYYTGSSSPDLLGTLVLFKDLEHLCIFYQRGQHPQRDSSIPVLEAVKHFASLNDLWIDLGIFPNREPMLSSTAHSLVLETLSLTGEVSELQDFLLNITSPSFRKLSLTIRGPGDGLVWKNLCERVTSSFPGIRSVMFSLSSTNPEGSPPLLARDLSAILSKSLTELYLYYISHQLTTDDLMAMVKASPNLHTLSIVHRQTEVQDQVAFDASVLIPLSQQQPCLCYLGLHLDLNALVTPLPDNTPLSRCMLEELGIYDPKHFPSTLEGRLMLAQNLLILFPRLRTIIHNIKEADGIADLQKCIVALNRRVAAYHFSNRM